MSTPSLCQNCAHDGACMKRQALCEFTPLLQDADRALSKALAATPEAYRRPQAAPAVPAAPVPTILPDGSAFAVASWPLPADHWLYAPRGEWDSERDEFAECPHPILTHDHRAEVVAAVRYAIRGATMCGKEMDFDPDALVLNAVYALCGPFGKAAAPTAGATAAPAEPVAQEQAAPPAKEALTDLISSLLAGALFCNRTWSAWGVGTMSEDDFSPVDESDVPADIADAVLTKYAAVLAAAPAAPVQALSDEQIDAVTMAQWGGNQLGVMVQAHRAYARAVLAVAVDAWGVNLAADKGGA